jgi:small ligand-binding sensory domain FIST
MPFASALSTLADSHQALEEAAGNALGRLGGKPDLAVLFLTPHHLPVLREGLAAEAAARLGARCQVGCPGQGLLADDREVEEGPALGVWLARWARPVTVSPFHVALSYTPDGPALMGWPDEMAGADAASSVVLLLADPWTFPIDAFLGRVNAEHKGLRVVGGMASGTRGAGHCRLIQGERTFDEGAVGVVLQGAPAIRSVVSQGCRPVGRHLVITKARDNLIQELGGKPAVAQLQELWQGLSPRDQDLIRRGGLHVGRVINEYQSEFQRGDFLVRNVVELDRDTGALAITDRVRVGQTVQFHVRDAETAGEDLHALLQLDLSAHERPPAGALVFSCNGRGTNLFPEPHHDARAVRAETGALPLAGFFAQGELGPVGGQNFIHGFTASVVLFEDG